jgi:taurine dioxygenase
MQVTPLTDRFGAEVWDVNVNTLSDGAFVALRQFWLRWKVLILRGQSMTPAQVVAFGARLGPGLPDQFIAPHPDHPELMEIVWDAQMPGRNFGGVWHTDVSYLSAPAQGTVLWPVKLPVEGGDTLFADLEAALAGLSEGMQRLLAGLKGNHMAMGPLERRRIESRDYTSFLSEQRKSVQAAHPLIRTHPETGRRCLFVNGNYLTHIVGLSDTESAPLLRFLCDHAQRAEYTCRVRWAMGSLVLWDNRCTLHKAIKDYSSRREMLRYTIQGTPPR